MDTSDPKARAIIEAALRLPEEARAALADRLLESLEDVEPAAELEAAWSAEIERRLGELRDGRIAPLQGDDVLEEMRRIAEE